MANNLKLTNGLVNELEAQRDAYIIWDPQLTGFAVRVNPGGRKTFFFKYNTLDRKTRKITIGKHGSLTAEEARRTAKIYAQRIAAGEDPVEKLNEYKNSITVQELFDLYTERHGKMHKKAKSVESDYHIWNKHIKEALGSTNIMAVQKADILKFHHSLRGIPYQANRALALLRHMFNKAEEWDILKPGSNPCAKVREYKEHSRERYLSKEEVKRLLETLDDIDREQSEHESVTRAIRLLLFTGCRKSEILTLKWDYVDFRNSCFHLPDSKTGKKCVPVGRAVIEMLLAIPRRNDTSYVIYGPRCGEFFRDIHHQWNRIRKRAGLPDVRIHDLRHTYASFAVAQGYSLPLIGNILGHRDSATTQRYAHVPLDPVRLATDDIAGVLSERH
ncbi:MAG: DUF4102 domain-containing protein [Verrucomicrobiae bacterium]|nr:DUF4102 domain-containing protein [Verrucomicrobiae bacterium]